MLTQKISVQFFEIYENEIRKTGYNTLTTNLKCIDRTAMVLSGEYL